MAGSVLALAGGTNSLLFDNLQELAAAAGGATALAIESRRRVGPERRLLTSLAISLAGANLGMLAWDMSHGIAAPLTAAGDVVFLASVGVAVGAIVPAIFSGLGRALLLGVATDTLILFLAGIAVVAAIQATDTAPLDRAASVGAVLLLAATGACAFALVTRRIAPAAGGPWVLLLGATVLGASWLMWLADPGAPSTVGLSDFMFSAGLLLIAFGGVTWETAPSQSPRFDRVAPLLAAGLPAVAILASLAVTAATAGPAVFDLVGISTAAVITTSVGRQLQLYVREAQARTAEERAFAALESKNEQLTASAAEIEDLYNRAPVGHFSLDDRGLITRINDTLLRWLGYERSEILGKRRLVELLEPTSRLAFEARFEAYRDTGLAREGEYELIRKDGASLAVLQSGTAIRDEAGNFVMCLGTIWDLTERRAAEEAVRASEERYRTLFEQATDSIAVIGSGGQLIDANEACSALLGYGISELYGVRMEDLVAPDSLADFEAASSSVQAGKPVLVELQLRTRDGGRVVAEVSAQLRSDGYVQVLMRDLSTRRTAEAEQRRLVAAVSQATDDILLNDPDGVIRYVNPAFERSTGYASAELIGRTVSSVLRNKRDDPEVDGDVEAALAHGEPWEGNIVNARRDGSLFEHHVTISPIRDVDGSLIGSVHVGRDLTRERELEAQLRQSAKMEAVGQLAGGVAHDFNNILTAIRGYAEFARIDSPEGSEAAADLDQVILAADRAAELTRQLLAFGRKTVLDPQVVGPAAIARDITPMLGRLVGEHIEFTVNAAPDTGNIRVDPAQLEQVILNLAVNARDAMPDGGRLQLETANVELDLPFQRRHPGSGLGPHVLLSVSDTGTGMDRATRAHIFEPFFTTKPVGQGTGLGLATVFGIVKMSGGYVDVDTAPGRGTRFGLYFPRVADEPSVAAEKRLRYDAPTGTETILLVEDDAAVRRFARRCLLDLGYTVLEAGGGAEAIAIASGQDQIDLLVSDIVMPGMQGPELRRRLNGLRPSLPAILVSGYPRRAAVGPSDKDDHLSYLAKPFSRESLARAVRTLLDGEEPAHIG